MVYIGYGLTDKWSDGRSHTTGVSTQPSANAYLRPSRRYTVLRSKGIRSMAKRLACRSSSLEHFIVFFPFANLSDARPIDACLFIAFTVSHFVDN